MANVHGAIAGRQPAGCYMATVFALTWPTDSCWQLHGDRLTRPLSSGAIAGLRELLVSFSGHSFAVQSPAWQTCQACRCTAKHRR